MNGVCLAKQRKAIRLKPSKFNLFGLNQSRSPNSHAWPMTPIRLMVDLFLQCSSTSDWQKLSTTAIIQQACLEASSKFFLSVPRPQGSSGLKLFYLTIQRLGPLSFWFKEVCLLPYRTKTQLGALIQKRRARTKSQNRIRFLAKAPLKLKQRNKRRG